MKSKLKPAVWAVLAFIMAVTLAAGCGVFSALSAAVSAVHDPDGRPRQDPPTTTSRP